MCSQHTTHILNIHRLLHDCHLPSNFLLKHNQVPLQPKVIILGAKLLQHFTGKNKSCTSSWPKQNSFQVNNRRRTLYIGIMLVVRIKNWTEKKMSIYPPETLGDQSGKRHNRNKVICQMSSYSPGWPQRAPSAHSVKQRATAWVWSLPGS